MVVPGNQWISLWTRAKPKAASQQPSIFDEDVHADAVLKWFDSMTGYKLVLNVIPLLAQKAVERLILDEESVVVREIVAEYFTKDLCASLRDLSEQPTRTAYMDFLDQLHEVEVQASEIVSICDLLKITNMKKPPDGSEDGSEDGLKYYDNIKDVISKLVSGKEVNLSRLDGLLKAPTLLSEYEKYYDTVKTMIGSSGNKRKFNSFPRPNRKEFILSVLAPRPGPNSKPSPQRLYASVREDELSMAACFTKDMYYR